MNTFIDNLLIRYREWQARRRDLEAGTGLDVAQRIDHDLSDRIRRQLRDDLAERRRRDRARLVKR